MLASLANTKLAKNCIQQIFCHSLAGDFAQGIYGGADVRHVALAVTVAAGLLMVSRVRYYSFKTLPFASRVPFVAVLVALLVLVALAVDTPRVLLAISGVYLLSGPLHWLVRRVRSRGGAAPAE